MAVDNDGISHQRRAPKGCFGARTQFREPPSPQGGQRAADVTHGYGLTLGPVNQVNSEACRCFRRKPLGTIRMKVDETSLYSPPATSTVRHRPDQKARVPLPSRRRNVFHNTGPWRSSWIDMAKVLFALRFGRTAFER